MNKKLKIKIDPKSNIMLVKVYCDSDFNDCSYALIKIDKKALEDIKALKSAFTIMEMQKKRNDDLPNLYKMSFWTPIWGADFIGDEDLPEDFEFKDSKGEETMRINKKIPLSGNLSCETNIMNVFDDGISFSANVRHSEVRLNTAIIRYKELGL